jgi:hypothetical protein
MKKRLYFLEDIDSGGQSARPLTGLESSAQSATCYGVGFDRKDKCDVYLPSYMGMGGTMSPLSFYTSSCLGQKSLTEEAKVKRQTAMD